MKITLGMFQLLCTNSQVTPRFLSLVEGMRKKNFPKDEHFMSCYTQLSTTPKQSGTNNAANLTYDICYNLRHFEKNGRNLQDPWSCRQTVTHQKYHFSDATSSWIIVQPPELWSSSVDRVKLCRDQRVSFEKPLEEFDFDFALSQHVQALRRKLHHVVTILEGTQATVRTISAFAKAIQDKAGISTRSGECFLRELDNISHDLYSHLTTSSELLNLSNDIKSMINAILEFRNQNVMKKNGIQLQRIAENDSKGKKVVADIAQWTYNDSRTMRIATVIAMFYLPASLVFALFSTCFVELHGSGTGLLVHKEIWIAMLSILVLIGGNSIFLWLWNRRGRKRYAHPSQKA
ncbi:hypothetical protein CC78DRAFT_82270 [Lojkania enalia]|uniref:CorA-like transporter domain-containing protein n=1 Tax=Lojkania enalia TaxID=147567 RepID=A0A9P4JXY0_9PLEO|nr:hypothetical protein CC78DRAFT_82270 [Didymosphaeria enalia]